jgi:hypothetical protein
MTRATLFVSWCHDDADAKKALLGQLYLGTLDGVEIERWEDSDLLVGADWRTEIRRRLDACDYGLLLLSPGFLASAFIRDEELPRLLGPEVDKVIPVMLKHVPLDGSRKLLGLETRQIFTGPGGRAFTASRGPARERFALELATAIRARVLHDAAAAR